MTTLPICEKLRLLASGHLRSPAAPIVTEARDTIEELYGALVRLGTYACAKYGNTDDGLWGAITQGIAACAKARGERP